jgi:hypothetical protein
MLPYISPLVISVIVLTHPRCWGVPHTRRRRQPYRLAVSMPSMPECHTINALRLEQNWTWQMLCDRMADAGVRMPLRSLHFLMTHEDTQDRMLDRTVYNLRKFITYAKRQGWIDKRGTVHAHEPELRSHDLDAAPRRTRLRKESVQSR